MSAGKRRAEADSQRLAAIVESSEDAIIGNSSKGIITSWNKGAEHIFGYTASEVIGRPVSILAAPDRPDEMPENLAKILQGRRVEPTRRGGAERMGGSLMLLCRFHLSAMRWVESSVRRK